MLYYIRCDDGTRWKVREAVSLDKACNAIAFARVRGSVGGSMTVNGQCVADVCVVNSDNTERVPYGPAY